MPPAPAPKLGADLFRSPALFVRQFDFQRRAALLVPMTRQTYRDSTFLDQRTQAAGEAGVTVPIRTLATLANRHAPPARPVNYLFHTALCGSTLISRCLDLPGKSFALKEPGPLHQIACIHRDRPAGRPIPVRVDDATLDQALGLSVTLLARTWEPGELPLIKPSDTCANLIAPLTATNTNTRAILLYHRIDDFAVAMLKADSRRSYLRGMIPRAAADLRDVTALAAIDPAPLSDAEAAAYVWLSLMHMYLDASRADHQNTRTLDASVFFASPGPTLAAIARHYRLNLAQREIDKIIRGPGFLADSKDPTKPFDREAYDAQRRAHKDGLSGEIAAARAWLDTHAGAIALPDSLPSPLEVTPGAS